MSGISGLGTTFNLPNYNGELIGLTPAETPLLSAIGGLNGGKQATQVEFEWQTYDLRDPGQRARLEGANAPTAEQRVRANARNVVEIHQETVSVSYTKQAAVRQYTSPSSAPFRAGAPLSGETAVIDEMSWQILQAVKTKARDVNYSFWNGEYQNPTDNTAPRKTRGLLQAITTNKIDLSTAAVSGIATATDTFTATAHGLSNNDAIVFTSVGSLSQPANVAVGRKYFVRDSAANTFKVAATVGGAAITVGTGTGVALIRPRTQVLSVDDVDALAQLAYDNGGLSDVTGATIAVNSTQRVALTKAFAAAYGQANPVTEGNVGGVRVDRVKTNFGEMNIMSDRMIPVDALVVVSLDQLDPVFLSIPDKGVFFVEPLAKTGSSDSVQLYGEIGLSYGAENQHAVYRGLKIA